MSYILVDQNGYVNDVGSVTGYADMYKFVKTQTGIPYLQKFMETGETTNQDAVVDDIASIISRVTDANIRLTLLNLAVSLKKADGIAIVTE